VIRVLIADDHQPFRQGLLRLLELIPDVQGIGEAGSGRSAKANETERR